jgi:hypothetical protein
LQITVLKNLTKPEINQNGFNRQNEPQSSHSADDCDFKKKILTFTIPHHYWIDLDEYYQSVNGLNSIGGIHEEL